MTIDPRRALSRLFRSVAPALVACATVVAFSGMSSSQDEPKPEPKVSKSAAKRKTAKAKSGAAAKKAEPAEAAAAAAEGGASLKFSRDIAPIFVANCLNCHNAERKRGEFDLSTFKKLMAGAKGGADKVLIAKKPEESPLVQHIKGDLDPKMPPGNNRNLSDAAIARIEQWVKEGALLDAGVNPDALINTIAATPETLRKEKLASMSSEERDKEAIALGLERYKKGDGGGDPESSIGAHFIVLSKLPSAKSAAVVKDLEKGFAQVKTLLSRPGKPALDSPEKVSVYVFTNRRAYVEFVRTVESREIDEATIAHANMTVESPYVALADPQGGRESAPAEPKAKSKKALASAPRTISGLALEQFVVGAASRAGKTPRWLSMGLGAYMASKVEPKGAYYRKLQAATVDQYKLGWQSKAQDALGDNGDEADIRAIGYSLVECLASNPARFARFVRGMLDGKEKLDEGIRYVYGFEGRENFLKTWGDWVASHYAGY